MSQTSIIAGTLIIAYIVFVTVNGELPMWMAMLGVGSGSGTFQSRGNCSLLPTGSTPPAAPAAPASTTGSGSSGVSGSW